MAAQGRPRLRNARFARREERQEDAPNAEDVPGTTLSFDEEPAVGSKPACLWEPRTSPNPATSTRANSWRTHLYQKELLASKHATEMAHFGTELIEKLSNLAKSGLRLYARTCADNRYAY